MNVSIAYIVTSWSRAAPNLYRTGPAYANLLPYILKLLVLLIRVNFSFLISGIDLLWNLAIFVIR